jgi:hypothetical protein
MSADPHALKLYLDGSCYKNPAVPTHAWPSFRNLGIGRMPVFQEGFHETTNNRMELSACIRAFEYVAEQGDGLIVSMISLIPGHLVCLLGGPERAGRAVRSHLCQHIPSDLRDFPEMRNPTPNPHSTFHEYERHRGLEPLIFPASPSENSFKFEGPIPSGTLTTFTRRISADCGYISV